MTVEQFVSHVPFFQDLEGPDLAAFAASAHTRTYGRGALLPQPVYPVRVVSFVEQGSVRLYLLNVEGRQLTVSTRRQGDYFWQVSTDAAGVPSSWAEALADGTLVHRFPRRHFDALVARYPSLALALIEDLSSHLGDAYTRLKDASLCSVEGKLAHVLLCLASGEPPTVVATHEELAAYLGTSRERVTKILRRWQHLGIVLQPHRCEVCILDPQRLDLLGN